MAFSHVTGLFLMCRIEKANLFMLMSEVILLLSLPQSSQPGKEDLPVAPP